MEYYANMTDETIIDIATRCNDSISDPVTREKARKIHIQFLQREREGCKKALEDFNNPKRKRKSSRTTKRDRPVVEEVTTGPEHMVMLSFGNEDSESFWMVLDLDTFNTMQLKGDEGDRERAAVPKKDGTPKHKVLEISLADLFASPWTSKFWGIHRYMIDKVFEGKFEYSQFLKKFNGEDSIHRHADITFEKNAECFALFLKEYPDTYPVLSKARYAGLHWTCGDVVLDPSKEVIVRSYLRNDYI
jgi:hypothetical protein